MGGFAGLQYHKLAQFKTKRHKNCHNDANFATGVLQCRTSGVKKYQVRLSRI